MRIDLYTQTVLTIIAACLVWIALGGPSLSPAVLAQANHADGIAISGWIDANGTEHRFPAPQGGTVAQALPVNTFQR